MIKKILLSIILVASIIPIQSTAFANTSFDNLKAAFIRNDDLWMKIGNKEWQITNGEYVRYPRWSHDGFWIAYLKGTKEAGNSLYTGELWLYNLKMNKHFKVKANVTDDFQWSPRKNQISFLTNKVLYVLNTELPSSFLASQLARNVSNFSWLPDGSGLLTSSKESEQLDSDIILSKIFLRTTRQKTVSKHFYTIPIGKNQYYVNTSQFKWSHDKKWVSFLLTPTASLSADSNSLCLLSHDGQVFKRADEMLNYEEWFQWAPTQSSLGYISGIGREANINKQFKLVNVPSFHYELFTPEGFVDRDLLWKNDSTLYVSRSKENKSANLDERPLPRIFEINTWTNKHRQVTFPSENEADFAPHLTRNNLIWVRMDRQTADILIAQPVNITKSKQWIKSITIGSSYYEKWNWSEVFSLYTGLNHE